MIPEGSEAPAFELPGLIDGERRRVALEEFLGEDVVVLAFYPADFNPACDGESGLDELDLFTMQRDVTVLAIGPDTLSSHEAFADAYDLAIPLLADTRREVADRYDVTFEGDLGQSLVERAVAVLGHDGEVAYTWHTREIETLPPVDEMTDAIEDTGDDDTAFSRYRVGHAHYVEGRRAFTSAMGSFEDSEWVMAQSDFHRAREEFEAAADQFASAVRFVDDPDLERYYEFTQEKATALWQAAEWLGKSANAYASGEGAEGRALREDAERPLETARDVGDPVDPDDWPPDFEGDGGDTALSEDRGRTDTSLTVDIDEAAAGEEAVDAESASESGSEADSGAGGDADGGDTIDDDELEALEAELAASQPADPTDEQLADEPTSVVDAPPAAEDASDAAAGEGDIDGDTIDDDDIEALEAELAANEPADDVASSDADGEAEADDQDADGATGDAGGSDPRRGDRDGDPTPDERDPPADPHADLADGSGDPPPAASGSLEPQGGGDAGEADGESTQEDDERDDEPDLAEPEGASGDDLADIPTADDLADGDDEDEREA